MGMRFLGSGAVALLLLGGMLGMQGCFKQDNGNTAGITTIGNTVAGTVVDGKGTLVVNAEVRLIGTAYNPVLDEQETGYKLGRTDDKGKYLFTEVDKGSYNLEAFRDGSGAWVKGIKLEAGDNGTVPDAMLTTPGAITVIFAGGPVKIGGHFFIPGTTRFAKVDAAARRAGLITLQYVPAGFYSSLKYMSPGETTGTNVLPTDFLQVVPNDTLVLNPYSPWKQVRRITVNTSATGADVNTDVTAFPVLVRLNSANFDFRYARKDGADLRFVNGNGAYLPYAVQDWDSAGATASVWVRLDTVYHADAIQNFLLFSGNSDSASLSNGPAVFSGADGYNGLWHLDDVTDLADGTAGKNTGLNHGAANVPGVIGKAAHFQGPAWADIPAKAFAGIDKNVSISFWEKADDALKPDKAELFGGQDSAGNVQLRWHGPYGDSLIYWQAGMTDSTNRDRIQRNADAEAQHRGQWNHWTLSKDGDKGEMKMYLNGKVWSSGTGKTKPIDKIVSFILSFYGSEAYALDEFGVSHIVRTDDWVKLSYETQKPGSTAVTVGK